MAADDYDDFEDLADVPTSQPMGATQVTVSVPTPTPEQVAGQMARMALSDGAYERPSLRSMAEEKLNELIETKVAEKASAVIEDILAKPLQRTDGFGQPVGEPVSLAAVISERIETWAMEMVTSEGKARPKGDSWGRERDQPRIHWLVQQVTSRDLQDAVAKEVDRIKAELKAAATQGIAKQIAERVAGMVLK